ncbi:uncharacterized protein VTP21DRAFT_5802 [Calcarisporiella thermophila]|uniref:uncharacterized protein n=1 Tax=Calcarisporiella thermophila TaxID=911321 RepID=UPI00374282DA
MVSIQDQNDPSYNVHTRENNLTPTDPQAPQPSIDNISDVEAVQPNMSNFRRYCILFIISLASILPGLSSTVYLPALPTVSEEFRVSNALTNTTVSLFILFMGIAPIFWSSASDYLRIRKIFFLVSIAIYIIVSIGAGLVHHIALLVVLRCIQSVGASAPMTLGAGTIEELWEPHERGTAFGFFFLGAFLGPVFGPIVGGALTQAFGWRSTFYFSAAMGGVCFLGVLIIFPWESPRSKEVGRFNPLAALSSLRYSIVMAMSLEIGITFGTLFAMETVIPTLFERAYHLNSLQTGLCYLGAGLGSTIGSTVSGRLADFAHQRSAKPQPEDRIWWHTWIGGAVIAPFGTLLFGWSVYAQMHLAVPIVAFTIANFGLAQVFSTASTYLVDIAKGKGSSITSASNMLRMVMAAILSVISDPIVSSINEGYFSLILCLLNYIGIGLLLYVKTRGEKIRQIKMTDI